MNPIERSAALPLLSRALLVAPALLLLPRSSDWKRIEPGLELAFPADHGAHPEYQTEWWYLTGHLEDDAGARFGFQFTLFRRGLEPDSPPAGASPLRAREAYAAHLALTDVARNETRFAERARRASPLATAAPDELALALDDWSLSRGADGALQLRAADPARAFGFELALHPAKPLVLHGEAGLSRKGAEPGNASAYVSWTRLAVSGTLALDGGRRAVHGSAWYDHEFGSSVLSEGIVGWDWFGLQLDDGRELMLFVLRDARGGASPFSSATLVAADGTARTLRREEFELRTSASWTSPRSGATYSAGWTITLPGADLELALAPLVADCELASPATGVTYWEGPVAVRGTAGGRGYAELTGYSGTMAGRF